MSVAADSITIKVMIYIRGMTLQWQLKDWNELMADELYEIIALRIRIFVVEQNCPYEDTDGKDKKSLHLFALDETGRCIACARLVKPGISYTEWSIGRVATSTEVRGTGIGIELMNRAMNYFKDNGNPDVRISAQTYLLKFYEMFGFVSTGKEYLEDDIPHTEMLATGN